MISYPEARYPLGTLAQKLESPADGDRDLQVLADFPARLSAMLAEPDLDWEARYREGSWTVRQLVHHLADSHLHALMRLKWALTEEEPEIKAYREAPTAELADYALPAEVALNMLEAIHLKMLTILQAVKADRLQTRYYHPERKRWFTLGQTATMYAWHSEHHLAHIQIALGRASVRQETASA